MGSPISALLCLWTIQNKNFGTDMQNMTYQYPSLIFKAAFLSFINSLHDKIKFTLEKGTNNTLHILGLTIKKVNLYFNDNLDLIVLFTSMCWEYAYSCRNPMDIINRLIDTGKGLS